jgi:hypothetical protein
MQRVHARMHDGQVFLILNGHVRLARRASAVRTRRREWDLVSLVDMRRDRSMRPPAVRRTRSAASSSWLCRGRAFGERRGLPFRFAPRGIELLLEPIVFAAQPIPFTLQSLNLSSESFDFTIFLCDGVVWVVRRRRSIRALGHAPVMPNLREKYKDEFGVASPSDATTR